jgi:uncharacterized protein (DUF302 family)
VTFTAEQGIISKPCHHSVDETVEKLKEILQVKGATLLALVDHSGEAERVGMKMLPTKLLIFGNFKAGTPLMIAVPSIAIDLPLKILIWEDTDGKVWVTYNSPSYLKERYGLPQELMQTVAVLETFATSGRGIGIGETSVKRSLFVENLDSKGENPWQESKLTRTRPITSMPNPAFINVHAKCSLTEP